MFGLGMSEIILILVLALIVIGPKKLPEVAKAFGKGYAEFKKVLNDFKDAVNIEEDKKTTNFSKKPHELRAIHTEKFKKSEDANEKSKADDEKLNKDNAADDEKKDNA
jgi:sec-independent protein translocase protein TatA/sec-independent protein translocase protein TatB